MHSVLLHTLFQVNTSHQICFFFLFFLTLQPHQNSQNCNTFITAGMCKYQMHVPPGFCPCVVLLGHVSQQRCLSTAELGMQAAWAGPAGNGGGGWELRAVSPGRRDMETALMDETISLPPLVASPWQRLNKKSQRKLKCWRHKTLQLLLILEIVGLIFGKLSWSAQEAIFQTIRILFEILLIQICIKCSSFHLQFLFILQIADGTEIYFQCHDQLLH